MKGPHLGMLLWAGRDLLRRPGSSVLFAACLAVLAAVTAVPMLLTQAVNDTARELLADSPSLIVRRVDAGGWRSLPAGEAMERARKVPGVIGALLCRPHVDENSVSARSNTASATRAASDFSCARRPKRDPAAKIDSTPPIAIITIRSVTRISNSVNARAATAVFDIESPSNSPTATASRSPASP